MQSKRLAVIDEPKAVCLVPVAVQGLVGKYEGRRLLGRPRRRWENGIRVEFWEIGWGCGLDSTGSAYGPVASCCECGDEPSGSCATELFI
jgi:hypothetical protein